MNDPLFTPAVEAYERETARRARLEEIYLEDLKEILAVPAGRRVLFRWLDRAGTFAPVSVGGEGTIRAAAVSDYGKARVMEIQEADPEGFVHIMLAGFNPGPNQGDGNE